MSEALPVLKSLHAKIAVNHFDSIQMLAASFLQWILFCCSCYLTRNSQHAVSHIIAVIAAIRLSVRPTACLSLCLLSCWYYVSATVDSKVWCHR